MIKTKLTGNILIANPLNPSEDGLDHSVIMIVSHTTEHVIGLRINKPVRNLSLADVCERVKVAYDGDDLVFQGGKLSTSKLYVLHSLDWEGLTTVALTDQIGITYDMSILTAISLGEGPEHFKACAGFMTWEGDLLERQLSGSKDTGDLEYAHKWELLPATTRNVFNSGLGLEHWHSAIEESAQHQAQQWLQSFSGFN